MKTTGLLGGMSWESTAQYYRAINEGVKNALGGLHSAKIVMYSVDFEPIEILQRQGDWAGAAKVLSSAAANVESAGADFLVICTNTMHIVAEEIARSINIPLLHIADATAQELQRSGVSTVGLLGTAFTMDQAFYKGRLRDRFGIDVLVPSAAERKLVHDVIYQELCLGRVSVDSRKSYLGIIDALAAQGAEAVILGCTEISMLVGQAHTDVPLFDTTAIHADAAVRFALEESR